MTLRRTERYYSFFAAPLNLPNGSIIREMQLIYQLSPDSEAIWSWFRAMNKAGARTNLGGLYAEAVNTPPNYAGEMGLTGQTITVDNANHSYYLVHTPSR